MPAGACALPAAANAGSRSEHAAGSGIAVVDGAFVAVVADCCRTTDTLAEFTDIARSAYRAVIARQSFGYKAAITRLGVTRVRGAWIAIAADFFDTGALAEYTLVAAGASRAVIAGERILNGATFARLWIACIARTRFLIITKLAQVHTTI